MTKQRTGNASIIFHNHPLCLPTVLYVGSVPVNEHRLVRVGHFKQHRPCTSDKDFPRELYIHHGMSQLYYVNIVISSHNYVIYVNNIVMCIDYFIRILSVLTSVLYLFYCIWAPRKNTYCNWLPMVNMFYK